MIGYLFFFSCFSFRLSFGVILDFFWDSLLPLSRFPLSPIAVPPACQYLTEVPFRAIEASGLIGSMRYRMAHPSGDVQSF